MGKKRERDWKARQRTSRENVENTFACYAVRIRSQSRSLFYEFCHTCTLHPMDGEAILLVKKRGAKSFADDNLWDMRDRHLIAHQEIGSSFAA